MKFKFTSVLSCIMAGMTALSLFSCGGGEASNPTESGEANVRKTETAETTETTETTQTNGTVGIPVGTIPDEGTVIYLDAGHGWGDIGCSIPGSDLYEKDVTLAITKLIRPYLESMGYTVVTTQQNDGSCMEELIDGIYKSTRRIAYANKIGAAYYVSIHVDSFDADPDVHGTRIYYYDHLNEQGTTVSSHGYAQQLARSIYEKLQGKEPLLRNDRDFNVIAMNQMPSVLIEVGFSTNPADAANMVDEEWQASFAHAVAMGIDAQAKADGKNPLVK